MTKVGLDALGTSTTLESNKSLGTTPIVANGHGSDAAALEAAFRAWATEKNVPFGSPDYLSSQQKQLVDEVVGNSRLVGIGESVHGIHEFLRVRKAIVEYLLKERDFAIVIMETGFPEALGLTDYVSGTAHKVPQMYEKTLTWGMGFYQELIDIIEWMREYNETHSRPVQFYGLDPAGGNGNLLPAFDRLITLLETQDPDYAAELAHRMRPLLAKLKTKRYFGHIEDIFKKFEKLPESERTQLLTCADELVRKVDGYQQTPDKLAGNLISMLARNIAGALLWAERSLNDKLPATDPNRRNLTYFRDRNMAENVIEILEKMHPGTRAIVLAHNLHLQKTVSSVLGEGVMGTYLLPYYQNDYKVFATTFDQGRVPSPLLPIFSVRAGMAPKQSFDGMLSRVGNSNMMLNLGLDKPAPVAAFLNQPFGFRDSHRDSMLIDAVPTQSFDAVIRFTKISPAKFNFSPWAWLKYHLSI